MTAVFSWRTPRPSVSQIRDHRTCALSYGGHEFVTIVRKGLRLHSKWLISNIRTFQKSEQPSVLRGLDNWRVYCICIYIYIYIYIIVLITWVRVWYGEIFHEQANLFSRAIKPESEISSNITLTSVISGLFHTRYLHWSSCCFLFCFFVCLFVCFCFFCCGFLLLWLWACAIQPWDNTLWYRELTVMYLKISLWRYLAWNKYIYTCIYLLFL